MRRTLLPAAVMAAIGVCAIAPAQTDYPGTKFEPVNISVKAGIGVPLDTALSNAASSYLGFGVEFQAPSSLLKSGDTYLNGDWFSQSLKGTPSFFNLGVNQRFYLGDDRVPGRRHYAFVGIGLDFLNVYTSDTVFAARGGFGSELGENIFAEVAAYVGDKSNNGVHPNMLSVWLGYRF